MNSQSMSQVNQYLARFQKILNTMAIQMLSADASGSITIDFINCMIPHHQAAIDMCENLFLYTKDRQLIELARNIITTQRREIKQMEEIRRTTSTPFNRIVDVQQYLTRYLAITRNMIFQMQNARRTSNINLNFTGEMIPHHQGAIQMCQNVLRYQIDPRLNQLATAIIEEQSRGVRSLLAIQERLVASQ